MGVGLQNLLTGLRFSELASLTVSQFELEHSMPHLVLHAPDDKEREGADIPLRPDLAIGIRQWLEFKLVELQEEARRQN